VRFAALLPLFLCFQNVAGINGGCRLLGRRAMTTHFPVAGIGASAGGIEALEAFFAALPAESGMAFVVVMHLDLLHESLLADIGRRTSIP
jgi:chemotaxis response regulator CheB